MSDASTGSWESAAASRWAILDPAGEPPGSVFPTVYIKDELLFVTQKLNGRLPDIKALAASAGWTASEFDLEVDEEVDSAVEDSPEARQTRRLRLTVASASDGVAPTPDAWSVLRQARANFPEIAGLSLNHVITTDSYDLNPFKANPFKANPFKANPFKANAPAVGMDSYASPGFGGRQPVSYLGSEPSLTEGNSRPLIAVLDTGCGEHPWFDGDVRVIPELQVQPGVVHPIGQDRPDTNPEEHPQRGRPLEGWLDDAAGHGTFIAGIIRQVAPDARIMPVRVADGDGVILENELIGALRRIVEYQDQAEERELPPIDVLNLSFSFFHETPGDPGAVSELGTLLWRLVEPEPESPRRPCFVVCSAGNDATERPTAPASLGEGQQRHIAVGALNPSGRTVALFSNIGDWVTFYAPGVAILSTLPKDFNGSLQPGNRDGRMDLRRETLDADDFRGGFGVWSGTSFAAPYVAGGIAQLLAEGKSPEDVLKVLYPEQPDEPQATVPVQAPDKLEDGAEDEEPHGPLAFVKRRGDLRLPFPPTG